MKKKNDDVFVQQRNQDAYKEIEEKICEFQKQILEKKHELEELENHRERELDSIFRDLLIVMDAFDRADSRLVEQFPDNEYVEKARKRYATARKKLNDLLSKNDVSEIIFPDGIIRMEDCQIVDTEPDFNKPDDTIISIEKKGYRRRGRLLRLAEVIVVKN